MIQSLRKRFLLIAMASLLGTLAVICVAIAGGMYQAIAQNADSIVQTLHQYDGDFPVPESAAGPESGGGFRVTQETPFETRYFVVRLTAEGEVIHVDAEHIAALDRQSIVERIGGMVGSGKDAGYSEHYRYGIFEESDGGMTVIVVDCYVQLRAFYMLLRVVTAVSLACALVVLILLVFLSKRVIRPFVDNLERQRQFVTDASHELKTPLAVLSANVGLMESMYGSNQWVTSAQTQIFRLDKLIKSLIELARTEETVQEAAAATFSLSEIAEVNLEAFQPLAESAGKTLTGQITPDLTMYGVQDHLFRLVTILLDNAIKYCDPGGTIRLALTSKNGNLCLTVSNPCAGMDAAQIPRFFDRFYRADSSRSRETGGYGIGLSTAKAIVSRHRGRLLARYGNGVITFTAVLPGPGCKKHWVRVQH